MGVKPLYYFQNESYLLFASEIRALLASGVVAKTLNTDAVQELFEFQSIAFPHSIIQDVEQLQAGSYLLAKNGKISVTQYWDITSIRKKLDFPNERTVHRQLYHLLSKSVEKRLISDVALGAFLSGGIDSSAVVALMAQASSEPVNTFNIGFYEEEFDESEYANLVAMKFNTRH